MDFIFQFGDSYPVEYSSSLWGDLLVAVVGAAIASGSAIWIFYKTIRSDERKSKLLKGQRDEERLKYFSALIRNILKFSAGQKMDYLAYSEALDTKPYEAHLVTYRIHHDLKRIQNKINQNEIYQSYLDQIGSSNDHINKFIAIYSNLDYLDAIVDAAANENVAGQKNIEKSRFTFKDKAEALLDYIGLLIEKIRKENPESFEGVPVWAALNGILGQFHQNRVDYGDLIYVQNGLIVPVRDRILRDFRDMKEAPEILQLTKKATHAFTDIRLNSENLATSFKQYYQQLDKIENDLRAKSMELLRKFGVESLEQLSFKFETNE